MATESAPKELLDNTKVETVPLIQWHAQVILNLCTEILTKDLGGYAAYVDNMRPHLDRLTALINAVPATRRFGP
jgi:hypothetical protein